LEPEWLGKDTPHRCRCAKGHECSPRPGGVQGGGGICRACANQDPATAWANFRKRVAELGGVVRASLFHVGAERAVAAPVSPSRADVVWAVVRVIAGCGDAGAAWWVACGCDAVSGRAHAAGGRRGW